MLKFSRLLSLSVVCLHRQLLSVAGSYAQLGYCHPTLAHAVASRMLVRAPGWSANDAEDIVSLAGALSVMGGDEPRATAAALRLGALHAVRFVFLTHRHM